LKFGEAFVDAKSNLNYMKTLIVILLWAILFVLCWPIALLMIFLLPLIWLILLPFRIIGFTLEIVFKFIGNVLMFPFRVIRAL
jgi:hypothetical protein